MIWCDFCDERAVYVAVTMDVPWEGSSPRLPLCQLHLVRYYLGLHYIARA